MHLSRASWPILVNLLLLGAVSPAAGPVMVLSVKDRANAYASIATTGRFAAIAWGATTREGVTDVYLAWSRDGGRTFAAPARVNTAEGEANFSWEQPPRIGLVDRAGREPVVVVMWTAKGRDGTRLLSARSENGGTTFTTASAVPGSDAAGNRGWESLAAMRDGSVVALWLDHRGLSMAGSGGSSMNHAEHQHVPTGENKTDGVRRAQLSQLFFANLTNADSSHSIARGVCYCCKTAMATDAAGAIYAAWRQVYEGNIRDIAFTKSTDGGRTFTPPVRVSEDNWVLDGCPENGPAIAVEPAGRIHVVWPTLVPGPTPSSPPTLALFYATSEDGRRFTARQQIPTEGVPRHPQIVVDARGLIRVAWDEQSAGSRNVALARGTIDRGGTARFYRVPIADDTAGSYPMLATADSATIVGWSGTPGQTVIRTVRLPE